MTTAVSGAVAEVELLRLQAHMTDFVLKANVQGLTQEESLVQPPAGGNCLNWVVGHLVSIYDEALQMLGQPTVLEPGVRQRYARGSEPVRDGSEAMPLSDLMAAWSQATERIDAGLATLTPEMLDRPAPMSPSNNPDETVRSLLTTVAFHQAYHAGQTGVLRRMAGKEGAIP